MLAKQQREQGFVLAIALMLMLLVGLVVVSSFERSGTEQRTATSSLPTASLQAAAEAGLHRVRKGVENKLADPPDGFPSDAKGACEAFLDNEFSDDSDLADLLGESGKGTSESNAVPVQGPAGEDHVFWWIDVTKTTECVEVDNETDHRVLKVISRAFAGEPNNPQAKLTLSGDLFFTQDDDTDTDFDGLGNLLGDEIPEGVVPFDELKAGFMLEAVENSLTCGSSGAHIGGTGKSCNEVKSNPEGVIFGQSAGMDKQAIRDFVDSELPQGESVKHIEVKRTDGSIVTLVIARGDVTTDDNPSGQSRDFTSLGDFGKETVIIHYGGTINLGSGNHDFVGLIYAPESDVVIESGSRSHNASIAGKSLTVSPGGELAGFYQGRKSNTEDDGDNSSGSGTSANMSFDFDYDYDMTED